MKRAIILAGGKGERLRPLTDAVPKSMVELAPGRPLLSFSLGWLQRHNVESVTICCGHLHDVITDYVGDGRKFGLQVEYLIETEPLGRGGALKRALKSLPVDEPVLAMNGDVLTNLTLADLKRFHQAQQCLATVVGTKLVCPYGVLDLGEAGLITGFSEKPVLPYWMNAGIYVLQPEIATMLPDVGDHETTTFPQLAARRQLRAYLTDAFWKTVDTLKDMAELKKAYQLDPALI